MEKVGGLAGKTGLRLDIVQFSTGLAGDAILLNCYVDGLYADVRSNGLK